MTIKSGDRIAVKIANWNGRGWSVVRENYIVYKKDGHLGIDYIAGPTTIPQFYPLNRFSGTTVGFENMDTGEMFHYDNITESVIAGYPLLYHA